MRYYLRKLCTLIITLFAVSALAFLAFQVLSGDPATTRLGTEATPEAVAALRHQMGLDRPIPVQYADWLRQFLFGNMGQSYSYSMSVKALMAPKLPITFTLTVMSFLMVVLIAIPLGVWQGKHAGEAPDVASGIVGQVVMSFPPFFLGMVFTLIFGIGLKLFTQGQFIHYSDSPSGFFGYLFFPALAIALPKASMTAKLLRASVVQELQKDYVRTARSRGRRFNSVLQVHVLRNAIIPAVTFLASMIPEIVTGSIIIEQVFTIPGVGRLLLASILSSDYPVVLAIVVMLAFLVVLMNFLADVLYQRIDPRIKVR